MSQLITIQGTPILFPTSGESPDWAPAVDAFAVAVEAALAGVAGAFDVSPQILAIDSSNPGTAELPNLTFPPSAVLAVFIKYAVRRTTSTNSGYQSGELEAVYNPNGPSGNLWDLSNVYQGNANVTFTMSDIGQLSFTTTTLAGLNHTGFISYSATALLNS